MKLGKTKLIGIVAFVALVVGASFGILLGASLNKEEASFDDDSSKPNRVVNENTLSMMIEQTAGAGDYKLETRSS